MSTTTTKAPPASVQTVLQDYRLHHSEASGDAARTSPGRPLSSSHGSSAAPPVNWDVPHRRVPPYRPTNRDRDQSEVAVYLNGAERTFITTMFTGLFVNASAAKAWRATVGKVNSSIFRYPVGGEM